MLSQDCLSLDPKEEKLLGVFIVFSKKREHDASLSLGKDADACRAACFPQINPKKNKRNCD
jgi:hypothetical protein